jgi:hypothetical protein
LNNLMRCISAAYGISLSAENQKTKTVETRLLQCLGWNACESKEARIRRQQSSSSGPGDDDEGITPAKSPWTLAKGGSKSALQSVVLAKLNQCAIDLATAGSTNTARTSRILLFTDGCPNYGDGSVVSSSEAALTGEVA